MNIRADSSGGEGHTVFLDFLASQRMCVRKGIHSPYILDIRWRSKRSHGARHPRNTCHHHRTGPGQRSSIGPGPEVL